MLLIAQTYFRGCSNQKIFHLPLFFGGWHHRSTSGALGNNGSEEIFFPHGSGIFQVAHPQKSPLTGTLFPNLGSPKAPSIAVQSLGELAGGLQNVMGNPPEMVTQT